MENNTPLIESLLERVAEYGKTSYELARLKVVDKTSDGISSFLPQTVVIAVMITFLLFLNVGIACWLGKILGELYDGFLVVAAFYAFLTLIMHLFMRKWLKRVFYDYLIKQLLN